MKANHTVHYIAGVITSMGYAGYFLPARADGQHPGLHPPQVGQEPVT
jgi:hypothetical protein